MIALFGATATFIAVLSTPWVSLGSTWTLQAIAMLAVELGAIVVMIAALRMTFGTVGMANRVRRLRPNHFELDHNYDHAHDLSDPGLS